MRILIFLVFLLMATFVFANEQIPQELISQLVQRRESIKEWALTCKEGPYEGQYSIYDNMCWQGDMVCYAGLSCLAAELAQDYETSDARASDVLAAQQEDGRWVRGPMFIGKNYGAGQDPDPADFSRDQARGVFAYSIAKGYLSQDPYENYVANKSILDWLKWIEDNNGKTCWEDSRTCELTVGTNNMFFNVLRELGILPDWNHGPLVRRFYRSKWYYRWGFLAELRLLPLDEWWRKKWYPRHLKANTCIQYRVLNMDPVTREIKNHSMARVFGKAARRIYEGDPKNPLYRLLYEGVTVDLVEQVLRQAPVEKPILTERLHDWSLQRHTSERAWERSDGHDFIYLINLILAKHEGLLVW